MTPAKYTRTLCYLALRLHEWALGRTAKAADLRAEKALKMFDSVAAQVQAMEDRLSVLRAERAEAYTNRCREADRALTVALAAAQEVKLLPFINKG